MAAPDISSTRSIARSGFIPVDGGFLFTALNPWLLGPTRRYLVNADQKQALIDIMTPRQPGRLWLHAGLIIGAVMVYTVGISLLWATFSPRPNPGLIDLFGLALTLLVPLYAVAIIATRRYLRRIQPIVSTAIPTRAKLSVGERYRAAGDNVSTILLVTGILLWSLSAAMNGIVIALAASKHRLAEPGSYLPILMIVLSVALVARFTWALRRRLRSSKS